MTTDSLLDDILSREGGYVDSAADRGGATNMGITATTLGEWRRLGRPATRDEVRKLQPTEARAIYAKRYVEPFAAIPFDELRAQLVDESVTDGVAGAIRVLQEVLGVLVDGIIGERTLRAIAIMPHRLVNNSLVAARVKKYALLAERDATQRVFLRGWLNRATSFYV